MALLERLRSRASGLSRRLVLAEPHDPRVLMAASEARKFAEIVLVGSVDELRGVRKLAEQKFGTSISLDGVWAVDPISARKTDLLEELADRLWERRRGKDLSSKEEAIKKVESSKLHFGNLLVGLDYADGQVAGSLATTADVVRAAVHCVGVGEGVGTASSFMLMRPQSSTANREAVVFADSGFVVNPSADQLVDIAVAAAKNAERLLPEMDAGRSPVKVAMLSFSTKGSGGGHEMAEKVRHATRLVQQRIRDEGLEERIMVDGELQFDAAFDMAVGERKAPESAVAGRAHVFVFPTLDAGNIGYKIAERMGGWKAVGPILQGFKKPTNDLSRGCSVDDIVDALAITALQGGEHSKRLERIPGAVQL